MIVRIACEIVLIGMIASAFVGATLGQWRGFLYGVVTIHAVRVRFDTGLLRWRDFGPCAVYQQYRRYAYLHGTTSVWPLAASFVCTLCVSMTALEYLMALVLVGLIAAFIVAWEAMCEPPRERSRPVHAAVYDGSAIVNHALLLPQGRGRLD